VKPLRVLYLIHTLGQGGAQRQLVTLINALDRGLVSPEVAYYFGLDLLRPDLERSGTPVHVLGRRGARDPRVALRLARLVRRGRYDLIHTYLDTPGILARVVSLGPHSPPVVLSERSVDLGRVRRRMVLERLLERRAAAIIANANAVKRHVEQTLPVWKGRVHLVPNGVAWSKPSEEIVRQAAAFRQRHATEGRDVLLGAVGRLSAEKNPHLLLDALEILPPDALARLAVVWVGAARDRSLLESVRNRVKALGMSDGVQFVPETHTVRAVYLAIDALVLTSKWEGCPNAVLEALADARPVLSTNVGDAGRIVETGATGWLVPEGDVGALASAIASLLGSPRERLIEMGATGASLVRREYSAERLVQRTMDVYRCVLGGVTSQSE
jgi:glycosyltransferase involved in cell wall biosynthesis